MNIDELIATLDQRGVQVWADEEKLKVNAPKGSLTPDLKTALTERKTEILAFLRQGGNALQNNGMGQDLSLQTIGRLIGGFAGSTANGFKCPTIEPSAMAAKLKVTFRPLPAGYQQQSILAFREMLQAKLQNNGVEVVPWEEATRELSHDVTLPLLNLKYTVKTRAVKSSINAMIDVERIPSAWGKVKVCVAENLYQLYSRFVLGDRKLSVSRIAQLISWAEDNIHDLEDPTNTQVIVLTDLDTEFISPDLSYQKKIPIGVNTLVRTFSEIVIGVSDSRISILNMNLSDSVFPVSEIDDFIAKSLVPKIYVPILPLPLSRFTIDEYDPKQSDYAQKLVKLGNELASTGLLPSGFKIDNVVRRQSHRDIVDWMANGRTGVSYGFLAYAEPPHYVGEVEISQAEWEQLSPVDGFSVDELRQNDADRWYLKTKIRDTYFFKQIPDIWLVSSRSGSNKTQLNLETDVLRIGLQGKLLLQLPQGIDPAGSDIKPSYDLYVMVALALGAALYTPSLIATGMPMVHFHGYPSAQWFTDQEYYTGILNPSVPCGTYESGVFNFLGIHDLANQHGDTLSLACLVEPDHGANIIAHDLDYLLTRLQTGIEQQQIELGGKFFRSLKQNLKVNAEPEAIRQTATVG